MLFALILAVAVIVALHRPFTLRDVGVWSVLVLLIVGALYLLTVA